MTVEQKAQEYAEKIALVNIGIIRNAYLVGYSEALDNIEKRIAEGKQNSQAEDILKKIEKKALEDHYEKQHPPRDIPMWKYSDKTPINSDEFLNRESDSNTTNYL